MNVDWSKIIEYKSYPRGPAFYSRKHNKIYVNPIVWKYPAYHEHVLEHEKRHYLISNKHKNFFVRVFLNTENEWRSFFIISLRPKLMKEFCSCHDEFRKIDFSKEEIEEYKSEFSIKFLSSQWVEQKLCEYLRPDDYGMVLLLTTVAYFFLRSIFHPFTYLMVNLFFFILLRIGKK